MKNSITVLISILLLLTACDAFKKTFNTFKSKETPTAASNLNSSTKSAPTCPNGSAPKVLSGNCEGTWKINKSAGKTDCEFVWGPKVTCASGSTALGLAASCYGSTVKSIGPNENIHTEKDCFEKFGRTPTTIKFEMLCCN
jgi:hypothetical protein